MRKLITLGTLFFLWSCGPVQSEKTILGEYRLVTPDETISLRIEPGHRYTELISDRNGGTQAASNTWSLDRKSYCLNLNGFIVPKGAIPEWLYPDGQHRNEANSIQIDNCLGVYRKYLTGEIRLENNPDHDEFDFVSVSGH